MFENYVVCPDNFHLLMLRLATVSHVFANAARSAIPDCNGEFRSETAEIVPCTQVGNTTFVHNPAIWSCNCCFITTDH